MSFASDGAHPLVAGTGIQDVGDAGELVGAAEEARGGRESFQQLAHVVDDVGREGLVLVVLGA